MSETELNDFGSLDHFLVYLAWLDVDNQRVRLGAEVPRLQSWVAAAHVLGHVIFLFRLLEKISSNILIDLGRLLKALIHFTAGMKLSKLNKLKLD